jgi:protein-S-isoprenylcysteine O-methyltransferase Ste14
MGSLPIRELTMSKALAERLTAWGFSWAGLRDNRRGEWWLVAQMVLIAAHLLPATPPPASLGLAWPPSLRLGGLALFTLGLALAGQGALNLGASLSPLPEPMADAPLVTTGAYGRCRHPLYQSLILCSLGVTVALGSLLHLGLMLALVVVLGFKARREEASLVLLHPAYVAYRRSTPAILPGLPWLDWRSA